MIKTALLCALRDILAIIYQRAVPQSDCIVVL